MKTVVYMTKTVFVGKRVVSARWYIMGKFSVIPLTKIAVSC